MVKETRNAKNRMPLLDVWPRSHSLDSSSILDSRARGVTLRALSLTARSAVHPLRLSLSRQPSVQLHPIMMSRGLILGCARKASQCSRVHLPRRFSSPCFDAMSHECAATCCRFPSPELSPSPNVTFVDLDASITVEAQPHAHAHPPRRASPASRRPPPWRSPRPPLPRPSP